MIACPAVLDMPRDLIAEVARLLVPGAAGAMVGAEHVAVLGLVGAQLPNLLRGVG